jgi:prepilin-type processing-associated H-X9-DG protein
VQSSSKLTNIVDTILANETTYSKSGFSSTYAKPLGIRTVLPSEMSEGNIMISDNLIFSNDRNYTVFRDLAGEHPFDAEHGYYMFSAVDGGGNIKKRLDSKVRIAMEVYDWTNEGDGKTAVAFADGHIEVLNVTTPHGELDIIEVLSTLGNGDGQL